MPEETPPAGEQAPHGTSPELRASHADRDRTVDALRIAAGEGQLTAAELDERLELALEARTVNQLAPLTADLRTTPVVGDARVAPKDLIRIERRHSNPVALVGRWVVPHRMELAVSWTAVTLDFTEAVLSQDTLRIDVDITGKTLTLITPPAIVVDLDALELPYTKLTHHQPTADPGTPVSLRVELVGKKTHGRLVIRPPRRPRRTFADRLRRRPRPSGG